LVLHQFIGNSNLLKNFRIILNILLLVIFKVFFRLFAKISNRFFFQIKYYNVDNLPISYLILFNCLKLL
jgi:hypothetical protein